MGEHRRRSVLLVCILIIKGCGAFLTRTPSYRISHHLRLDGASKDVDTANTDVAEELPFLALPGAGGSSFDPLQSENRFAPVAEGKDLQEAKFVNSKFSLQYTCKKCETRNSNQVSRIAYRNGVVIVVCKGCMAKHLIADNLGWHNYIGGFEQKGDIESYLKANGRNDIKRVSSDVFELESLLDKTSQPDTQGAVDDSDIE